MNPLHSIGPLLGTSAPRLALYVNGGAQQADESWNADAAGHVHASLRCERRCFGALQVTITFLLASPSWSANLRFNSLYFSKSHGDTRMQRQSTSNSDQRRSNVYQGMGAVTGRWIRPQELQHTNLGCSQFYDKICGHLWWNRQTGKSRLPVGLWWYLLTLMIFFNQITPLLGKKSTYDNSRMRTVLGIEPTLLKSTLVDMANSMIERNYIKKP